MMSTRDFIPRTDAEFDAWQGNLIALVDPNVVLWGIAADDLDALKTRQEIWAAAFRKASNKQNRTTADVRAKDDARTVYEKDLRKFVAQWLANNSKVTDSDRERMDLTVKSGMRTPVAVPVSSPIGTIDFSVRQQHSIHFVDGLTGSKAKPDGVHGCEIWTKVGGDPPKDDAEFVYEATDTRSPYVINFGVAQVGKVIYYRLRWINKRGQAGPWSSTINALIAG